MKRTAALFAVLAATTAVVPASAPAATSGSGSEDGQLCLLLKFCLLPR